MENLNKISTDILKIFEIVCVISDEKELFFQDATVLLEKIVEANKLISSIKLDPIIDEIWEYSSFPDREEHIIRLVNNRFDKLITWKPHTVSILEMNEKLTEDLESFYIRQACIDRNYESFEITIINSLYKEIGQRAYKLDSELAEIMKVFFERIEYEQLEMGSVSERFNFTLNPEKASHFAYLLTKMHEHNFFTPIYKEIGISDVEVLLAFGNLFKCDLFDLYMQIDHSNYLPIADFKEFNDFNPAIIQASEQSDFTGKSFPEFLLYPEKIKLAELIRKEFSQEKGKNLRLVLKILETQNPPLITIGYRQGKILYNAMQQYFNWNIGSYQSIFNYKVDENNDVHDLENISIRFKHLFNTL